MRNDKIISALKYLEYCGVDVPNNILGDTLIRPNLAPNYAWSIKFEAGTPLLYGTEAKSRDDFESGMAASTVLTDEYLDNDTFQQNIFDLVEQKHFEFDAEYKAIILKDLRYKENKENAVRYHTIRRVEQRLYDLYWEEPISKLNNKL